jgi:hypothetical protein
VSVSENSAKFVPLSASGFVAANASAVLPVLVSVTGIAALFMPLGCDPKFMEVADSVATGPLAPVPVKDTTGKMLALSLTVRLALKLPVVVGVKVTAIVQFAPAVMEAQLLGTAENRLGFVPPKIILEVNVWFPVLYSVRL